MTPKLTQLAAGHDIPKGDRIVHVPGSEDPAIGRKGQGPTLLPTKPPRLLRSLFQLAGYLFGRQIPNLNIILAGSGEDLTIGAKGYCPAVVRTRQGTYFFARYRLPQRYDVTLTRGFTAPGDELAVNREDCRFPHPWPPVFPQHLSS